MQKPELEKLIRLYLKAETDIINEIARLRTLGLADYHVVAALDRVQTILKKLTADCWEYVPKMIEREFYVYHPEARLPGMYLTPLEHLAAYQNALNLTMEQVAIAERLTFTLMNDLEDASRTVLEDLSYTLGRREPDVFRTLQNREVTKIRATGNRKKSVEEIVTTLQNEGVTAFVDKSGRHWRLHTYASMATRTTDRQANTMAVLTQSEDDLYMITSTNTACGLCAPYEGRVYSKSGVDPDFPPLADAFGMIDPAGPRVLSNTWLNIHPNCLHSIVRWTKAGRSEAEIQKMIRFSSPVNNPYTRDPRSEEQIKAYRAKEKARRNYLNDRNQWERYRVTIPEQTPKTFGTFMKHKTLNDDKYKGWLKAYRQENRRLKDEANAESN